MSYPIKSLLVIFALSAWSLSSEVALSQAVSAETFSVKFEKSLNYLLHLPEGYQSDDLKAWPLVLFLHGAGERGDNLDLVKVHGPPKLIAEGQKFPFILLAPQCPSGQWWETNVIEALLEKTEEEYRVDPDRIYVTGLSMGGYGTWALAMENPDKFAAIAPICGGGVPYRTRSITNLPIWTFHGDADTAVAISETQTLVDELKKRGSDVKFTIYPEVGHDSWTQTYNNPELFEWLLSKKRVPEKAE